jgi:hypothetical protein
MVLGASRTDGSRCSDSTGGSASSPTTAGEQRRYRCGSARTFQIERHESSWNTVLEVRARQASPFCWCSTTSRAGDFWLDFKPCRKGSARRFAETYRNQNYPAGRTKFALLVSPQLIKDLQTLDFSEATISLSCCARGYEDEGNMKEICGSRCFTTKNQPCNTAL